MLNYNFKRIPTIPKHEELLKRAFSKAKEEGRRAKAQRGASYVRAKRGEIKKVEAAAEVVRSSFELVIKRTPVLEELPPFYFELVDLLVGVARLRKSLGALGWVISTSKRLESDYKRKIGQARKEEEMIRLRREFHGRLASLVRQVKEQLAFLADVREKLKKLPTFESEFTVVIAGAPNVGKSTLLRALTGARVRVESYPFTTRQILVGYFERDYQRFQVLDTPGLLDRQIEKRNPIEKQAVLALKHLANAVLFLFDPSETCGYSAQEQVNTYREVKGNFKVEVIPVVNKADLLTQEKLEKFEALLGEPALRCSAEKKENLEAIVEKVAALRKAGQNLSTEV